MRKVEKDKSTFCKMVDKMCQLNPECENYHETRVMVSEEFLKAVKEMQGTDLEPYLAEIRKIPKEGSLVIGFKILLLSYTELMNLR